MWAWWHWCKVTSLWWRWSCCWSAPKCSGRRLFGFLKLDFPVPEKFKGWLSVTPHSLWWACPAMFTSHIRCDWSYPHCPYSGACFWCTVATPISNHGGQAIRGGPWWGCICCAHHTNLLSHSTQHQCCYGRRFSTYCLPLSPHIPHPWRQRKHVYWVQKKGRWRGQHGVVATILIITYRQVPAWQFICSPVKIWNEISLLV